MEAPALTLEKPLRVGELAKRTGKTVRALHLYEEMGLLKPIHRSKGGFRLYAPSAVSRVTWICRLQEAGFSLHQLQDLRGIVESSPAAPQAMGKLREIFATQLDDTRAQVKRLLQLEVELEASLAYLQGCESCAPVHKTDECGHCDQPSHHGMEPPLLVAGIHRG